MADSVKRTVWKTGGQVDNIVWDLLAHSFDRDEGVRLSVARSVQALGEAQPELVLSAAAEFVRRAGSKGSPAIEHGHRVQILRIMHDVSEEVRARLSLELASDVVGFAAAEMVASKENQTDWQGAASAILVSLGVKFANPVMDALLGLFKPGNVPPYFVVKCLADLAAANPLEFAYRLREVTSRVIPVLGSIRDEPLKWAFTTALGRFAESALHFAVNADADMQGRVSLIDFAPDFNMALDVIFNNWLMSKEAKVRLAVLESIGCMARLLSPEHFSAQLPRLVQAFLGMYKKEKLSDHFPITQGLCLICEVAVDALAGVSAASAAASASSPASPALGLTPGLEAQLASIMPCLHPLVAVPLDYRVPATVRNHSELLRCFEVLARAFLDAVLAFLFQRLQAKEPALRFASLIVIRHLIISCDRLLSDRKDYVLASVQVMVDEPSIRVRRAFMQVIVAMADAHYLQLEGGHNLVTFLVKQSAISQSDVANFESSGARRREDEFNCGDSVTPQQLRQAADHILGVLTTKVTETHPVLWPFLLESFKNPLTFGAMGTLCRALHHILAVHADDPAFTTLRFDVQVNLPRPQLLLVRFFSLFTTPFNPRASGVALLRAFQSLAPLLHVHLGHVASEHVPALIEFLEGQTEESLSISKWEDYILKLFKEIVGGLDSEVWLTELVDHLTNAIEWVQCMPVPKRVLMRYLGATLACIRNREFIKLKIDFILDKTNNADDIDRHGAAQSLGLCAKSHLDLILEKLTGVIKRVENARKGGLFGFGESKDAADAEIIRSTVSLCLGFVVAYAPAELVVSRVEVHVLNQMLPLMQGSKTAVLREQLIKSVDLIGKSLHSSRLAKPFLLRQRDEFIHQLLVFLRDASNGLPALVPLRVLGVNCLATLANLDPPLSPDVRTAMLNEILPYFEQDEVRLGSECTELTLTNINAVLSSLLQMEPTLVLLHHLLVRIEKWLSSARPQERERATLASLVLLKKFVSKCTVEQVSQKEKRFTSLGDLLGASLPRCADSRVAIRLAAVDNVQALLYIDQVLKNPADIRPSQDILLLTEIRTRLESDVQSMRFDAIQDLGALLAQLVVPDDLCPLLCRLMDGLNDPDLEASLGVARLLQTLFSLRGVELGVLPAAGMNAINAGLNAGPIATLTAQGLVAISKMLNPTIVEQSLGALRVLASQHFAAFVDILLNLPLLPLAPEAVQCFCMLGRTPALVVPLLNTLLATINDSPFSDDKPVPIVRMATCALEEVMKVDLVVAEFAEFNTPILCSLLLRVGSAFGVDPGPSSEEAVDALHAFLTSANESSLIAKCNDAQVWALLKTRDYEVGIMAFVEFLCQVHPELMRGFFEYLIPFLSRVYVGHRSVATAVIAEFIKHSQRDAALLRKSIGVLLPRVGDKHPRVRRQALKGIGNLVTVWSDEVAAQASSIMSALMAAMEDQVDVVAAQAVQSSIQIVGVVDDATMAAMLVNICFRMRPAFDRSESSIRSSAFVLFGRLTRFGSGVGAENFADQLQTNIPIFLVHLNDEVADVRKSCLEGFNQLVQLLDHDDMTASLSGFCAEAHEFDSFIEIFVPTLVKHHLPYLGGYVQSVLAYFRSPWPAVRGNAAIVLAHLLKHTPAAARRRLDLTDTCAALMALLSEPSPIVRGKAAKALSFLSDI